MRVRRTFCFIDLSGFTALTNTSGDEHAVSVLSSFRTMTRDVCSRRAVRIAKWLGDGAMLVSTECTPLLATALELRANTRFGDDPLAVRCGISTGEVILLEGDDYIGHAVNLAARLCDVAGDNEVLAVPEVVDFLPPWGCVEGSAKHQLRGIDQPIEVVHLGLSPTGPGAVEDPICGLSLTQQTAFAISRDGAGDPLLFCSDSCKDTWDRRPAPQPEEQGSLRIPLVGF